ncbi:PKD domain-containing protein [Algibacter sp. L3A6]|uniref:PKD domain-containing protein n=1 Tax=Algibacter sp. L3A6 TaxID=2686366 RepID=UPI00131C100E|nr:PKD domain-containing protein [Algibacter sp. L3A6]
MKNFTLQALLFSLIASTLYFGLIQNETKTMETTALNPRIPIESEHQIVKPLPPSANISGNATVCKNASLEPEITFTGSSGVAPYIFTYNINGGSSLTITTTGTNNSISIDASTQNTGTFVYNLLSVEDNNNEITTTSSQATITVTNSPNTNLGGTGSGSTFEGQSVFRQCSNSTATFTFTNTSTTSTLNTSYSIDWGDGSTEFNETTWSTTTHTYPVGKHNLTYTITGDNGCDTTENYIVFVGSNPGVSLGNPGNTDICNSRTLTFPITGAENNAPGTTYTVTFNDGSVPETFNHPPPSEITHDFTSSSCNTTSSDGTNFYENSFSAIIVATNPCSSSSVGVVPIYVSIAPEADFDSPDKTCTNTSTCFTNTSIGEENLGSGSVCDTSPNIVWEVSPNTGYSIASGSLGNDFGLADGNSWLPGSDQLCLNFTSPGNYTVTLKTGNKCGSDDITKTICVEPELTPVFTLNNTEGCAPLAVQTTNTSDLSESCGGEEYLWEVTYTSGPCATGAEQWTFTGGTDENSAAPTFNFETSGTYNLKLTVTNSCGSSNTTQTIEVKQPPKATINSIADVCGSASITPIATVDSCAPASEVLTYAWSFPGGSPATANTLDPGTITYATSGDYEITFSVTSSCGTTTDKETFSINPIPNITNTNLTQTICSGTDTDTVTLTSDIVNTIYSWTATAPTGITGYTASGTSNVIPVQTLTNSNTTSEAVTFTITPSIGGCDGTPVNLVITVGPAPEFTIQPQPETICLNGAVTDLTVAVNGPGTPTYLWHSNTTDNNTTGTPIPSETSNSFTPPNTPTEITYYYVIASFTSGAGCDEITSQTARVEIVESVQIDSQPLNSQSICIGGTIPSALSVTHSGGTGTVSYQWYINSTNSNISGTAISGANNINYTPPAFTLAGNYYYYIMISLNGSGCSPITSDASEVIVSNTPVVNTQPTLTQTLCQGIAPKNLEVSVSGGIGSSYTYQWYSNSVNSNSGGTLITSATNNIFTPPTSTIGTLYYYAEISQTSFNCTTTSDTAEVVVNAAPAITAQPVSATYCLGDVINPLSVSYADGVGTPTYQWYSNSTSDTNTGTNISGEIRSSFNPPSGTVSNNYYYVVITFSSGGCTLITSDAAQITINQTPSINATSDIICSGTSFNITPSSSGGNTVPTGTTYTWTAPIINPIGTISGASAENSPQSSISQTLTNSTTNPSTVTYTVTPTSGICIGNNFTVTITVNPSISINSTVTHSNCFGANSGALDISISGGVPFSTGNPYQISWSGPNGFSSTSEDISNLEPGDYTVNILDDGGCPFTETFNIKEPDALIFSNIDFDSETISCFGANDGSIGIEISGGTAPYTYAWTRNGSPFANTEDLNNLAPGDYEVTVTDARSCTPITQDFEIIEPTVLDVTLVNQTNIDCFGFSTGAININTTGGRPIEVAPSVYDNSYTWQGPNGFTSNQQNIAGLIAGTYQITVTDKSNCTDTLEVILTESDEIIINYTATEIKCYGDNDAAITINNITGGNAPYTIAWSNLGSGNSQTNLSPGTYIITVTDATNCEKEAAVIIEEVPIFEITPSTTNVSCFGANDGRIVLNLVGGITPLNLVWNDDPTSGVERNNMGPGTYTVTITDGTPCEITETFTITEPDILTLSGNSTDALDCADANSGQINLIVTGGTLPLTYLWSNGSTTEDLNNIPPGDYSVLVTDANGCDISGNWTINRFEPHEIIVNTNTIFDCEAKTVQQTFEAQASGGVPPYSYT